MNVPTPNPVETSAMYKTPRVAPAPIASRRATPPAPGARALAIALALALVFAAGCGEDEAPADGSDAADSAADSQPEAGPDLASDVPDVVADLAPDLPPDVARDLADDVREDAADDAADAASPDAGPAFACRNAEPLRQPFFGETHVHTWYSFDSYLLGNYCNGPAEAFAFARGATQTLAPFDDACESIRTTPGWDEITLRRPLDFAAVTDHSEFLGEMLICTTEGEPGYNAAACETVRTAALGETMEDRQTAGQVAGFFFSDILSSSEPTQLDFCESRGVDCEGASAQAWGRVQDAANAADDPCEFSAFIGYEYSGIPGNSMVHRNMIFRTSEVPAQPVTYIDAPDAESLWARLIADCIEADDLDCDVLAIPHNPNYSTGQLFGDISGAGGAVMSRAEAEQRARLEPLVEIAQVKGTSECWGAYSADEFCNHEITEQRAVCTGSDDPEGCVPACPDGVGVECSSPYDYVRGVLGLGLVVEAATGANPYRLGFVGGSDSHNATPGATDEDFFPGHSGAIDQTPETALAATPEADNAVAPRRRGPHGGPGSRRRAPGLRDRLRPARVAGRRVPTGGVRRPHQRDLHGGGLVQRRDRGAHLRRPERVADPAAARGLAALRREGILRGRGLHPRHPRRRRQHGGGPRGGQRRRAGHARGEPPRQRVRHRLDAAPHRRRARLGLGPRRALDAPRRPRLRRHARRLDDGHRALHATGARPHRRLRGGRRHLPRRHLHELRPHGRDHARLRLPFRALIQMSEPLEGPPCARGVRGRWRRRP